MQNMSANPKMCIIYSLTFLYYIFEPIYKLVFEAEPFLEIDKLI